MSWTDADAPEIEQQALRLCMAFKDHVCSWWSAWDHNGMEQAWVAVAEKCSKRRTGTMPIPSELFDMYRSAARLYQPRTWYILDNVERSGWCAVFHTANDIWRS
jgi:hypothetical protein